MRDYTQFYTNGEWVDPIEPNTIDVINPANEEVCAQISMASDLTMVGENPPALDMLFPNAQSHD